MRDIFEMAGMVALKSAACFCFPLTFENYQSTYAILEQCGVGSARSTLGTF